MPISHVITYSNAGSTVCVSSPSKSVEPNLPICEGLLDGQVVHVLRDIGCTSIIVKKSLVSPSQMTGKQMQIRMLCGYIIAPSAVVKIDSPYFIGTIEALCIEEPPQGVDIIIGNIPGARDPYNPYKNWSHTTLIVTTRLQEKSEKEKSTFKLLKVPDSVNGNVGPEEIREEQQNDPMLSKV